MKVKNNHGSKFSCDYHSSLSSTTAVQIRIISQNMNYFTEIISPLNKCSFVENLFSTFFAVRVNPKFVFDNRGCKFDSFGWIDGDAKQKT